MDPGNTPRPAATRRDLERIRRPRIHYARVTRTVHPHRHRHARTLHTSVPHHVPPTYTQTRLHAPTRHTGRATCAIRGEPARAGPVHHVIAISPEASLIFRLGHENGGRAATAAQRVAGRGSVAGRSFAAPSSLAPARRVAYTTRTPRRCSGARISRSRLANMGTHYSRILGVHPLAAWLPGAGAAIRAVLDLQLLNSTGYTVSLSYPTSHSNFRLAQVHGKFSRTFLWYSILLGWPINRCVSSPPFPR